MSFTKTIASSGFFEEAFSFYSIENNPVPFAFLNYLNDHLPSPENHKIYFDFGTETIDTWQESFQLKADEIMKSKGFTTKNWLNEKFP